MHISEILEQNLVLKIMPSGFPSLDRVGLIKEGEGEFLVVAGIPGSGKSAFMFQLAENIANNGPVYVVSLEMSPRSVINRLLSATTNLNLNHIQYGIADKEILQKGKDKLRSLNYYFHRSGGAHINEISNAIIDVNRRHGLKAVFIDHLQIIKGDRDHSREREVAIITYELKSLAKELKIPVILATQLNKGGFVRGNMTGDFRPNLGDIKESSAIVQDADMLMFIHRPGMFDKDRYSLNKVEFIIAKNRNGEIKTISMEYCQYQTKFIDGDSDI